MKKVVVVDTPEAYETMMAHLFTQQRLAVDTETNGIEAIKLWKRVYELQQEHQHAELRLERIKYVHKKRYKNSKAAPTFEVREQQAALVKSLSKELTASTRLAEKNPGGLEPHLNSIQCVQIGTDHRENNGTTTAYVIRPSVIDTAELERLFSTRKELIFHNAKFDVKLFMHHWDFDLAWDNLVDTQAGEYVLTMGTDTRVSLKAVLKKYCGVETDKQVRMSDWSSDWTDSMVQYAATDVLWLHDIVAKQNALLEDGLWNALQIEEQLIPVLARMELTGVGIDLEMAKAARDQAYQLWHAKIAEVSSALPECENVMSPVQLAEALREAGKSEASTSNEADLRKMEDKELSTTILEMRHYAKDYATYYLPIVENSHLVDGCYRIHGSFNSTTSAGSDDKASTDTGRLSASKPNLQNQKTTATFMFNGEERKLRSIYVPREGFVFVNADLDQIEPRIAAHVAGEPILKEAFATGKDPYLMMAARKGVLDIDELMCMYTSEDKEEVNRAKEYRKPEKAGLLSVMYGKTKFGLAKDMGCDVAAASKFLRDFFNDYQRLARWVRLEIGRAKKLGYVETLCGHRRYLGDINSECKWKREKAERAACNTKIQGTAAGGMKRSLVLIDKDIRRRGLQNDVFIVLTVHDEITLEVRNDPVIIEASKELLERGLVDGTGELIPSVPVTCEAGVFSNWGEAK